MARTYTDTERADAIALVLDVGPTEASKTLGIPKSTLASWLTPDQQAAMAERSTAKTRAATEAHALASAEKRALLGRELLDAARIHVARSIAADNGKDAQHYMTAGAIGLDKFRLEQGEVTDRTEHVAAPERTPEVEEGLALLFDLAEHRAA